MRLIVSLAAGLIVTKGGTEGAANEAVLAQLGKFPKALYMAAGLLCGIGLLPGFPLADSLPVLGCGSLPGTRLHNACGPEWSTLHYTRLQTVENE